MAAVRGAAVGAISGAATLAAGYAALRRSGLTTVDLAETLLPGRRVLGRLAQGAAGSAACLPSALLATPTPALLAGAAAGCAAATTQRGSRDRVLAVAMHTIAGVVAGCVSRAVRARR